MKYWFYLEPYTFIFGGVQGKIIYNTLNGNIVNVPPAALPLINELEKDGSGYTVELEEGLLENEIIRSFIKEIRENFSGDILSNEAHKPFVCKPILDLLNDPRKLLAKEGRTLTSDLLSYLHEVNLYLDSNCTYHCTHCTGYCKQFPWCTTFEHITTSLSIEDYENLFGFLSTVGVKQLNLFGGDILHNSLLDPLIDIANSFSIKSNIYINYLNLKPFIDEKLEIINSQYIVLARAKDVNLQSILQCINKIESIEWRVSVTSIEEYLMVEKAFEKLPVKVEICPYYDGNNYDFFFDNVFVDLEEITSSIHSKRDVFVKQVLNTNFFGKLTIIPNGDVYANLNRKPLGNLKEHSLNELVYKEIEGGNTWLNTRNEKICAQCIYKYLCPSISNYELVLQRMNMCHIHE